MPSSQPLTYLGVFSLLTVGHLDLEPESAKLIPKLVAYPRHGLGCLGLLVGLWLGAEAAAATILDVLWAPADLGSL